MSETSTLRVSLRPFTEQHLTDKYVGWLNDATVTRFSERRREAHTLESCREYLRGLSQSGDWFLAIHVTGEQWDDEHVGNISVYFDRPNRNADIAILIGKTRIWGHGVGYRSFISAIEQIWAGSDVEKITAGTLAVNESMLRIMRKAGMKPDGVRHAHARWNAARMDVLHYALFRGE
jgi:[ribosomal protein S5]-alanine N-acetyltransferase